MSAISFFRETALPALNDRVARSFYLIGPAGEPDHLELYITGNTAANIKRLYTRADIIQLISDTVSAEKPNSTPTQLDDAVSKAHAHSNMTKLGKVGEDAQSNMTYNGSLPKTGWDKEDW